LTHKLPDESKTEQSGRQTVLRLIIFWRTCTPAILFWAYLYATPGHLIFGILAKFSGV